MEPKYSIGTKVKHNNFSSIIFTIDAFDADINIYLLKSSKKHFGLHSASTTKLGSLKGKRRDNRYWWGDERNTIEVNE